MKWTLSKKDTEWRRWFAWKPVEIETEDKTETTYVWLKFILRKREPGYLLYFYKEEE